MMQETQHGNNNIGNHFNDSTTNNHVSTIGFYSSLHARRGDLQCKFVKMPAEEWHENAKDILLPKELIRIATDETNRSFFEPLTKQHNQCLANCTRRSL